MLTTSQHYVYATCGKSKRSTAFKRFSVLCLAFAYCPHTTPTPSHKTHTHVHRYFQRFERCEATLASEPSINMTPPPEPTLWYAHLSFALLALLPLFTAILTSHGCHKLSVCLSLRHFTFYTLHGVAFHNLPLAYVLSECACVCVCECVCVRQCRILAAWLVCAKD